MTIDAGGEAEQIHRCRSGSLDHDAEAQRRTPMSAADDTTGLAAARPPVVVGLRLGKSGCPHVDPLSDPARARAREVGREQRGWAGALITSSLGQLRATCCDQPARGSDAAEYGGVLVLP